MRTITYGDRRLGSVLLVEDEENDVLLIERAFGKAEVHNPVLHAGDGEQALAFLQETQAHLAACKVSLLITDIKMPKLDGFELLGWLQARPEFDWLPRIVLSSSARKEDVERSRRLGAQAYFVKPLDHGDLVNLVQRWKRDFLLQEAPLNSRTGTPLWDPAVASW